MATAAEGGHYTDHFNRPAVGHAAVQANDDLLAEDAQQRPREPSSSTDLSFRSEGLPGAAECSKPSVAVESHEPQRAAIRLANSAEAEPSPGSTSDASVADLLEAVPPTDHARADEVEDGSVEPPSDESDGELDEADASRAG